MTIYNLGNRVVNNYLIGTANNYVLIDTGYAGGFRRFQRRLKQYHIEAKEIKFVFLTHAHDDHAGFLNDVLRVTDAKVVLHPKAVEGLKRGQNSFNGGCSSRIAWLFCQVLALFGKGEHRYPAIKEEYFGRIVTIDHLRGPGFPFLTDYMSGDTGESADQAELTIFETPGHTADHISLLAGDILFCGDAAMNGFPSRKRTTIWIEDLEQYKKSWKKIIKINPRMVYPAHGKPFPVSDLKRYLLSLDKVKLYPLKERRTPFA